MEKPQIGDWYFLKNGETITVVGYSDSDSEVKYKFNESEFNESEFDSTNIWDWVKFPLQKVTGIMKELI